MQNKEEEKGFSIKTDLVKNESCSQLIDQQTNINTIPSVLKCEISYQHNDV